MSTPQRPDPSVYPKMRDNALQLRPTGIADDQVYAVLMDWHVGNGTASVLAAADGTASVYLSSGGGYIGGGQRYPAIRDAALHAVGIAAQLLPQMKKTESTALPPEDSVSFFVTTGDGLHLGMVREEDLAQGTDPLGPLGGAMQAIISQYRLTSQNPPATAKPGP